MAPRGMQLRETQKTRLGHRVLPGSTPLQQRTRYVPVDAAIHSNFHESQAVFLVHEQLEVGLQEVSIANEIHIASVRSQVIKDIYHMVAEEIRFPINAINVTRCGLSR
ncbi:hypothetical protein CGCSCA1_v014309 [Colletotrichum siamense]|nr:hypothetical protein CGCSCA1_v014309 [Colletotrichum siamense]